MSWMNKREEMHGQLRKLNKTIPEVTKAFAGVSASVKTDGALDVKTKELIAIAIAVADGCEPCVNFHVEVLIKSGGTREELGEALGMAVQMGGGPALMYAAKALDAFDELSEALGTAGG
ncbi:carboxymuconolactone decarboxylase family protein [Rhodobacteraceae bacterium W635]|uniref:carboxymuconolactone decarboxylase family protein n=1 Tax=Nioella halotolerans TaxID=2303578 RepID=UPI000E3DF44B|nr:carboxymuconolactone decarboxylase family protein [Rhodobacteraceae bacterium W635]